MKSKSKLVAKSFKATLERIPSRFNWVTIRIPFDVSKVWRTPAKVRVKGEINGFPLRAWVFPTSKGYQCMLIKKSLQTGGNASVGDTAHFRLEPDTAKRVAIVPIELQHILNEDRSFRRDRKSTRLNSSHLVISYAVFCLKKKQKTTRTVTRL